MSFYGLRNSLCLIYVPDVPLQFMVLIAVDNLKSVVEYFCCAKYVACGKGIIMASRVADPLDRFKGFRRARLDLFKVFYPGVRIDADSLMMLVYCAARHLAVSQEKFNCEAEPVSCGTRVDP
jgi:hypothetical protein